MNAGTVPAIVGALLASSLIIASSTASYFGFFDTDPYVDFPAHGDRTSDFAAVMFSGDLGFRTGKGNSIAAPFEARGVPVLGVSSPVAFGRWHNRDQIVAIVERAIDEAGRRFGKSRTIVIGHSYGADISAVVLPSLPVARKDKIGALFLIVPGENVYFRADPTTLSYRGRPDADAQAAQSIDWLPVLCLKGVKETDSLCPLLTRANVRQVALPGGHALANDSVAIKRSLGNAIDAMLPQLVRPALQR